MSQATVFSAAWNQPAHTACQARGKVPDEPISGADPPPSHPKPLLLPPVVLRVSPFPVMGAACFLLVSKVLHINCLLKGGLWPLLPPAPHRAKQYRGPVTASKSVENGVRKNQLLHFADQETDLGERKEAIYPDLAR